MKIYPSEHTIIENEKTNLKDIPLAYIDTEDSEYYFNITKEPYVANSKVFEEVLMPYQEFDDPDIYFFDENNEFTTIPLKRINNTYVYEPQNMIEFSPMLFSTSVLIKKNMTFSNNRKYNIKVAVREEDSELTFSNQLIPIFGDAPRRGLCPNNITVNNQNMLPQSLINSAYEENDFIFAITKDGNEIKTSDGTAILDIETILSYNVNLWLTVDEFGDVLKEKEDSIFKLQNPILYNTSLYEIKDYKYHFDLEKENPLFPKSLFNYSTIFDLHSPILILEMPKKGFVIITHKTFFDNLYDNTKLFYEIMMQVFLQSYYKSKEFTSWITNEPIDYMAYKYSRYDLRHENINLETLLKNDNYNINNEYTISNVNVSNENILFLNLNDKKDMFFYKVNNVQPDPPKNNGDISYYTTKQSVIHYEPQVIKKIETGITIETEINVNGYYITIMPCKSSEYKINTTIPITFKIPDIKKSYYVCCMKSVMGAENFMQLIDVDDYSSESGLILATIKIVKKEKTTLYDIRILGGGLPISQENSYDMMDISHIYGRPYRLGSSMIIKMPKKLEPYEKILISEIEKHMASEDYPILVFE